MPEPSSGLVVRGVPDKLPPGAILLTKIEAERKQWDLLTNWTPKSDVWALRFGHVILSTAVGVSCLLITSYYRKRLKLGTFGKFTTQLPTVFVPSFLSSVLQIKYVSTPIMLQNECPVCLQLRSCLFQTICSVAYPAILAPLASFGYAYKYGSYQLPKASLQNAKEYFQIYWSFTRKYQRTLSYMLVANALLATFITYKGGTMYYDIQLKILTERANIEKIVSKASSQLLANKQTIENSEQEV